MDRVEEGSDEEGVLRGVADMRLLLDALNRSANPEVFLLIDEFSITDDPVGAENDGFFLNVEAPRPDGAHGRDEWAVDLSRWVPDDDWDDEVGGSASGESVLRCVRSTPPGVSEIVVLLDRSGGRQDQLAMWSKTPVGEVLAGTSFVVTRRYGD
ncbi:hypothetical protein [Amycolatopsis dongchuanensis]|uniref:Uncharacterized protein n=1 Tax=Amycolatopsis dongchuanensis TaxID=1070866 RepID=A0ABP9Q163_9PSEU